MQVVLDESGFSKGYGFVRFGNESEQQHALANMTGESGVGSKPIKVSMANQKSRATAASASAQIGSLDMGGGRGHQNGSAGNWGSPLDGGPMGGGVSGGSGAPNRGGGESGWPGVQSQPTAAWNQPAAATHIAAAAAAATHPDFSTYQHYYSQYAQQFSQQQQQYAAAWYAWQQQQP